MKFRPCIDIHDGKVKQIVGGALSDEASGKTNFVSEVDASFYAEMYRSRNLSGGHIILLNKTGTPEYEADLTEAQLAMNAYQKGFMIGGGVTLENAESFLNMGASHVIVTSYVFRDGVIDMPRLEHLTKTIGREHLVLDLSCRIRTTPFDVQKENDNCETLKNSGSYYIVTDRWQKFTNVKLNHDTLDLLASYCDEYLIHAVDVEGKRSGIDSELITLLGSWDKLPLTYAGGVSSLSDLTKVKALGQDKVDVTVGSALSLFGGDMDLDDIISTCSKPL